MNLISIIVLVILILICAILTFISKALNSKLELKKLISEIIITSDKIEDLSVKSRKYELPPKNLPTLLKLYYKPPEFFAIDNENMERFGKGQVREYVWAQTCFALMSTINLKNKIYLFQKIIKNNHIWYSNFAFEVLCYHYLKTKESALMNYFSAIIEEKDTFAPLAYLNILSIIKSNSEVDKIFATQIEKLIHLNSYMGYVDCYHIFRMWYNSNAELRNKNSNVLLKISMSSDNKLNGGSSFDFEFKDEMRARALNLYLKICKADKVAIDFYNKWVEMENKIEIIKILNEN